MQPGEGSDAMTHFLTVRFRRFPILDKRIIREIGNLDDLSGIITENFKFEVVIIPQDRIHIDERNLG
jgi:hypothetical protein